jgi:SAM-dependent methyltransferase
MFLRKLYYTLGPKTRRLTRRAYYLPADTLDLLTGRRDSMTPPKGRIFIGSGDFKQQGIRLMNQLIKHGGLQPNHRVLDVGSGIGRLAIPLTQYLSADGVYQGFDIVKTGVDWCTKNISSRYPNFEFKHIDLVNDLYNLETKDEAKNFVFPYPDKSVDLVFLFSVFSHMIEPDVANYLKEIARVLKPGGKCVATFFVLNEESRNRMDAGSGLQFKYKMEITM